MFRMNFALNGHKALTLKKTLPCFGYEHLYAT